MYLKILNEVQLLRSAMAIHTMIILIAFSHCVYFANARQECSASKFSCQFNDPCDPLCVLDQHVYPGRSDGVYVECVEDACAEQQCPRRTIWNQTSQSCEGRGNGLEARCSYGKFDCEDRNPCTPALCEDGVENYPGPSPRWYVNCTEGCVRGQCPRRQVWNQDQQRCVRKSITHCESGSNCKTCADSDLTICTSCETNYVLNTQGQCVQECQISRRPIQHLEKLYRGLTIFVDFTFQCAGAVSSLEFYAEHPGTFYFSAWRPSASGDDWTLQGYNTIRVEVEGAQNYTIPSDAQLIVDASDVFGIFYPKGRHPRIISSKNIKKRERDGTSSRYVHTHDTLDDLEFGFNRSTLANEGNSERIIPFNANISG